MAVYLSIVTSVYSLWKAPSGEAVLIRGITDFPRV